MSKKPLFFHDGQNYRIVMNYYYKRLTGYVYVYDPETGSRKVPVYAQDDVRGYESRQTTTRTFTNGGFGTSSWINSALKTGYPPTSPHYGEIINGAPDYWTAKYDAYRATVKIGGVGGIPAVLLGHEVSTRSNGGLIYQDVYMVSNQPLQPGKSYTLSFYAKGSGSGTRAYFLWYIDGVQQLERPQDSKPISGDWNHYTLSVTSISMPPTAKTLSVRVTFEAPSGQYAYISSTSFG